MPEHRTAAKWLCACGTTIRSSGTIPNETQWMLMSDQDKRQEDAAVASGAHGQRRR
jgi:hypothetical protein